MLSIEFDEKVPIYIQIMDIVKKDIINKRLVGGEKLKSVRELAEELKVNPNTVQRAYQELERDEIAFSERGMGRFVTKDEDKIKEIKISMAKDVIDNFLNGMESLGFEKEEIVEVVRENLKDDMEV